MRRLLALLLTFSMGCASMDKCLAILKDCPPDRWHHNNGSCVCLPVPLPTPEASPSVPPTPSPSPLPSPSPQEPLPPSPSPVPPHPACGAMPECGGPETPPGSGIWGCCREGQPSRYKQVVQQAVDDVLREHGWIPSVPLTNPGLFIALVMEKVDNAGYCVTHGGPSDEIGVKLDNSYSEQFDIVNRNGTAQVHHAASCTPARF